jgi:hypothetical protein
MLIEPYSFYLCVHLRFCCYQSSDTKLMSEPGRLRVGIRQYKGLIWTIGGIVAIRDQIWGRSYWLEGSIFLIALIFHFPFSSTTINVLHIFRMVPSALVISYRQSAMAVVELSIFILSTFKVLVPGCVLELLTMPATAEAIPFRHSPFETS